MHNVTIVAGFFLLGITCASGQIRTPPSAGARPASEIDLGQYFPNATIEQAQREALLRNVGAFVQFPTSSLNSPKAMLDWLLRRDSLYRDLEKHDIYGYLRAEEDLSDRADAASQTEVSQAMVQIDAATTHALVTLSPATVRNFEQDPALAPYEYFIESTLRAASHENQDERAVTLLARPALNSLRDAYRSLLREVQPAAKPAGTESNDEQTFHAEWSPFTSNETAFAGLLIPIVELQNGRAQLEGFQSAPEAAYFSRSLTLDEVNQTLAAVRRSDAYKHYEMAVAEAAARKLKTPVADIRPWDLTTLDSYHPPSTTFQDAVGLILAAERPMGGDFSGQFVRLFDPASHRVELCESDKCDHTGFSVGFAGSTSALFYGSYDGTTNRIRAVAHEAGHAVHREFMNENQPIAAYNSGPNFVSESFAIFNEFLLLDHLYRTAVTPAEKAYYLHRFLDDATFQVYGSAKETDLEQSIYAGVENGSVRNAADLDALTQKIFSEYVPAPALSPEMKVYWARNRLFFTDPLYDVNYLFAGLLALNYFEQFEADRQGFSQRYVALLKNGFSDTPRALERRFLNIDLDDADGLVSSAATFIDQRRSILERLYQEAEQAK
jgi:oligoendopeptidase F